MLQNIKKTLLAMADESNELNFASATAEDADLEVYETLKIAENSGYSIAP